MRFRHAGGRVLTGLAALALLASCSAPVARRAPPDGPTAPGATLAWSRTTATGTRPFAVVGETVLLADGTALLGLGRTDGVEKWRLPFTPTQRKPMHGRGDLRGGRRHERAHHHGLQRPA